MRTRAGRPGGLPRLAVLCTALLELQACQRRPTPAQTMSDAGGGTGRPTIRIGSAFGPFVTPLTAEYRRQLPDLQFIAADASTSSAVLQTLEAGTLDVGVATADDAYDDVWGPQTGATTPQGHVRAMALLQPLPVYLLAGAGSRIGSVADLSRRRVGISTPGSVSNAVGRRVLTAFGVNDARIVTGSGREVLLDQLRQGQIDAIFLTGYVYPDDTTRQAMASGAYVVGIDGPAVASLRHHSPFLRSVPIASGLGTPSGARHTIGVNLIVVTRQDLGEDLVYRLTEAMFAGFSQLAGVEDTLRFLQIDDALATPIPLHPGAARYFRERELRR